MAKEIVLEFKNYKLLKDKKFDLTGHNVVVFEGANEIGKSSVITGLEELLSVMSYTTQPVTQGQQEGYKRVTWEGLDGKIYTIEHTFDVKDGKGKFVAFDEDANPIKSVTKIRELIGQYQRLSVEEFFEKAKTVPGRKKLVEDYFNQLLTTKEQEEIVVNNAYLQKAYEERTKFGRLIEILKPQIKDPTEEEKAILAKEEKARESVKLREQQLRDYEGLNIRHSQLNEMVGKLNFTFADIKKELEKFHIEWDIAGLAEWINKTVMILDGEIEKITVPNKEDLELRLTNGKNILEQCATIKGRLGQLDGIKQQLKEVNESHAASNLDVERYRKRIRAVYENSKLPAGLVIEEEGFLLDGFDLTKEQISESHVKLAIAEMMCQIDKSGLIVMGNANVFGKERLDHLCELAEKHNKLLFLERVVDDVTDIRAVGIIETIPGKAKKEKVQKPEVSQPPIAEIQPEVDDEPL